MAKGVRNKCTMHDFENNFYITEIYNFSWFHNCLVFNHSNFLICVCNSSQCDISYLIILNFQIKHVIYKLRKLSLSLLKLKYTGQRRNRSHVLRPMIYDMYLNKVQIDLGTCCKTNEENANSNGIEQVAQEWRVYTKI